MSCEARNHGQHLDSTAPTLGMLGQEFEASWNYFSKNEKTGKESSHESQIVGSLCLSVQGHTTKLV